MTKSILQAIDNKPDDQAEWQNILQLMYHLRQALACSVCGKLVSDPYTPIQEPCHCVCSTCKGVHTQIRHNCATCRQAFQSKEDRFERNSDLNYTAVGFVQLCKLLVAKEMVSKWSNLQNLGEKFRKKVKQKEHHCRCGSGAKKNEGRGPGNLTCLGQRCACYKEGKACIKCKCVGCKNPNGNTSNEFRNEEPIMSPATTTTIQKPALI